MSLGVVYFFAQVACKGDSSVLQSMMTVPVSHIAKAFVTTFLFVQQIIYLFSSADPMYTYTESHML